VEETASEAQAAAACRGRGGPRPACTSRTRCRSLAPRLLRRARGRLIEPAIAPWGSTGRSEFALLSSFRARESHGLDHGHRVQPGGRGPDLGIAPRSCGTRRIRAPASVLLAAHGGQLDGVLRARLSVHVTVAVCAREDQLVGWPIFHVVMMNALAWIAFLRRLPGRPHAGAGMIAGIGWQDLVALSATLGAGAWLFRRWLLKRRAKAGCDTCAPRCTPGWRERRRAARLVPSLQNHGPSDGGPIRLTVAIVVASSLAAGTAPAAFAVSADSSHALPRSPETWNDSAPPCRATLHTRRRVVRGRCRGRCRARDALDRWADEEVPENNAQFAGHVSHA